MEEPLSTSAAFSLLDLLDRNRVDQSIYSGFRFIIWPLILGAILSFFIAYYRRRVIGALVRAIRNAEAVDEESAKTIAELGQANNASAISALKRSKVLRRLIHVCGDETENIDENTRVYIPEEMVTAARAQYGETEEPIYPIILGSVALIVLGVIAVLIFPK